ncbi:MAG: hypothetical protein ABIP39_12455 [Polyangiaceae bacterium]
MRARLPILLALAAASCRPDLGDRDSLVTSERILAVRGEPPEARPGEPVSYTILVANAQGTIAVPPVNWAFCASPKLLSENNVVSPDCVADAVRPFANGTPAPTANIPDDACAIFGPETPPGGLRPHDPDVTGGFYQPVRAEVDAKIAFGLERVLCHLANASADVAGDFAKRYVPNKNPSLGALVATVDGAPRPLDRLPAGKPVRIALAWPLEDAESYVTFDIASQTLLDHREAMRVSWFVSGGELDADRTGRTETEMIAGTDNGWMPPSNPTQIQLWIVLRDSRGGMAFATYTLTTTR